MLKTVSFYTLGCRLNQAETASLENSFRENGYHLVNADQPSDIAIINTCTVTENSDSDTRRLVNRINRINPNVRIALIGCQAQIQKEKLTRLPNVNLVLGTERKMDLINVLKEIAGLEGPTVITPTIQKKNFTMATAKTDCHHTRANLKIQDGCDFFCSFCEIPYARGRARSRIFDDVLKEARILAASGHKEIVLTGINVGMYNYENKSIIDVVDALDKIQGLVRIRISSIEPKTIGLELIDRMGKTKLCRFMHIPLQSGSKEILKAMNRRYSIKEFSDFIRASRARVPELCIGTDCIVGFPGETDKHFEETFSLLQELPVTYIHVFSYSKRTHAKSKDLSGAVSISKIQQRSERLRQLSVQKRQLYFEKLLGTTQHVLFEEKKGSWWTGLTDHYVRVKILASKNLRNTIIPVKIKKIDGLTVIGSLE